MASFAATGALVMAAGTGFFATAAALTRVAGNASGLAAATPLALAVTETRGRNVYAAS